MQRAKHTNELSGARHEKRIFIALLTMSIITNVGLVAGLLTKKDTHSVSFIPPELNRPFTLTESGYSNAYVEQVATWFLAQTLNYTPASFEYQMNTFLKHVDPDLFTQLRGTLLEEYQSIQKQRRSSTFYPQEVQIKGLTAIVTGSRQIKIGSTNASLDKEHWFVKLTKRHDGYVTLSDFKQVSDSDAANFLQAS